MMFLYKQFKANKGNKIRVKFSAPTRVLFMDEKQFNRYKNNQTFTYFGGHKEDSPYDFVVPRSTRWYTVVEKGSYYEPKDIEAQVGLVTSDGALGNTSLDSTVIGMGDVD
jgi:hypothetical protein